MKKASDKITESTSLYKNLDKMSVDMILQGINTEDRKVASAVGKLIGPISELVSLIVQRMKKGGRLFYIGSGTSGRLGIVDASECPPTFGVPHDLVTGIIAGGDKAIRRAVEFAEDNTAQGWKDLIKNGITKKDTVIGLSASGSTPYVLSTMEMARKNGNLTAGITCNIGSALSKVVDFPLEVKVGPEFVTGSTRMKSGTAQKLILNMISTSVMIKLGKVKGNKMVDMQLTNNKLIDRGSRMIMEELKVGRKKAEELLQKHGSVRKAVEKNK